MTFFTIGRNFVPIVSLKLQKCLELSLGSEHIDTKRGIQSLHDVILHETVTVAYTL